MTTERTRLTRPSVEAAGQSETESVERDARDELPEIGRKNHLGVPHVMRTVVGQEQKLSAVHVLRHTLLRSSTVCEIFSDRRLPRCEVVDGRLPERVRRDRRRRPTAPSTGTPARRPTTSGSVDGGAAGSGEATDDRRQTTLSERCDGEGA